MVSLAPWFWAMAFWRKRFQLKGDTCYPAGWRWGLASAAAGSVPNVAKTEPQTECIFFKSQKYISNLFFYIFVICFFHVLHSFSMRCPMPLRCLCILCDPGQLTEFSACLFQGFMSIHVSISDVFKGIPASLPGPWEMFSHIGWELCCGFWGFWVRSSSVRQCRPKQRQIILRTWQLLDSMSVTSLTLLTGFGILCNEAAHTLCWSLLYHHWSHRMHSVRARGPVLLWTLAHACEQVLV